MFDKTFVKKNAFAIVFIKSLINKVVSMYGAQYSSTNLYKL
jgi:hypothetical protein